VPRSARARCFFAAVRRRTAPAVYGAKAEAFCQRRGMPLPPARDAMRALRAATRFAAAAAYSSQRLQRNATPAAKTRISECHGEPRDIYRYARLHNGAMPCHSRDMARYMRLLI